MRRFAFGWLIVLGLFSFVAAQSGVKIKPTPTPAAAETTNAEDADYSDSAPTKPRSIYVSPKARDEKTKSKNKGEAKGRTKQTAPAPPATSQPNDDDGEVLKVETNLITIPVSVFDRNGLYIPSLRQTDFKIFEDGKEQEIAYFGTSDKPFTVVLLIDTSPSTEYKIDEIRRAATAFVDQLKAQDKVMVIEFDANVHVLTEATGDRQKIYKAIRRADFGDGTGLFDAVDFSLNKRLGKIEGRKAIVLFTDGVDTASYKARYESTVDAAEESEAMIFPIYYNTFLAARGIGTGGAMSVPPTLGVPEDDDPMTNARGTTSAEYALGKKYLEDLAAATGGRVFRPEATPGGLVAAFEGIAEELRRQYNIGYYPQAESQAGQRKQIKVRVNRPNLVVRSRDSYIAGATKQAPGPK